MVAAATTPLLRRGRCATCIWSRAKRETSDSRAALASALPHPHPFFENISENRCEIIAFNFFSSW